MYKNKLALLTVLITSAVSITGCSQLKTEIQTAVANNQDIKLSVDGETGTAQKEAITWVELDQLKTYKDLRSVWDDKFQIINFDTSSKNGVLYVDTEGNWSSNNTLYNIFQNKTFANDFWSDGKIRSALAQAAEDQFSDITNESTGIIASINAYFNIMPVNEDGTSGLLTNLSRAEVMSAIYRCDTPVTFEDTNTDFESAVGLSDYNDYAQGLTSDSYLTYENGSLNYGTYNSAMTRCEVIYMLMHRYFNEELQNASTSGSLDVKNAGNVAESLGITGQHAYQTYELEYCLQNPDKGLTEPLYKALVLANNLGIISSETSWNSTVSGGWLLNTIVKTYQTIADKDGYLVNAKSGANAGQSLISDQVAVEDNVVTETLGTVTIEQVRDVTNLDDLFAIYGDEVNMTDDEIDEVYTNINGYTFEPVDKWMQVDYCTYLNVRTGPSTDFRILRSVAKGTKAHIVARCVETGWYRIIADGKIVYQCGVYFSEFEGSDEYLMRTGENANDNSNLTNKKKDTSSSTSTSSESSESESVTESSTESENLADSATEAETDEIYDNSESESEGETRETLDI